MSEQSRLASVRSVEAAITSSGAREAATGAKEGGGTSPVNVNIYNQHPGARVESRPSQNGRDMEIIISEVMARDIHRNGPVARSLQMTHGLQRTGTGR